MRKILLVLGLGITVFSCKKEEIKPQTPAPLETDSIVGQQEQLLKIKINK